MNKHQAPLRFAIMLQDETLKRWQSEVIEKLCNSGYASPVLLIMNDGYHNPEHNKPIAKPDVLWHIYEKLFLRKGSLDNIPLPDSIIDCKRLKCKVQRRGKFSEYFIQQDIEEIKKYNPDFILRFGFSIIRGEILKLAKYGVWSFHHSDEKAIRGGPAGFWEVFLNHKSNGVILQQLTEHLDGGIVLKKRFYKTIVHDCAFHIHHVLNSSTDMPVQVCADIINGCADYFHASPSLSKAKVYTWPGLLRMFVFPFKQFWRRFIYHMRNLFLHEKWAIGISEGSVDDVMNKGLQQKPTHIFEYKSNRIYPADPFALKTEKGLRLFFEKYDYSTGKAGIHTIKYDNEQKFGKEKQLSDFSVHRSFPFVFTFDGQTFLMPEQIETGRVDLYLWDENSEQLNYHQTILNQPLADPVLINKDNKWWLFGSAPGMNVNNSLNLYYAENINGPFAEHPQNPIVYNPSGARMAGDFILHNGKLYRPGQDSQNKYGKQTLLFEVIQLNETFYSEKQISTIQPFKDKRLRKGLHTLNFYPSFYVFDGKKYVFSLHGLRLRLKQKRDR